MDHFLVSNDESFDIKLIYASRYEYSYTNRYINTRCFSKKVSSLRTGCADIVIHLQTIIEDHTAHDWEQKTPSNEILAIDHRIHNDRVSSTLRIMKGDFCERYGWKQNLLLSRPVNPKPHQSKFITP